MRDERVSAGIVLYNPDLEKLDRNVAAISPQVGVVLCFDNGSGNIASIRDLLLRYENVALIEGGENLGIPVALNRMSQEAAQRGYAWFLSLDQDSVCPPDMVSTLMSYEGTERVGALCPLFIDSRRPRVPVPEADWSEVDCCITSGMLMRLDVYAAVGGMDERLFIGLVDDEYCYRLRLSGYRIVRANRVVLDHELGEIRPSRMRAFWLALGGLLHNRKVEALSFKRKVIPMRVYYGTRNTLYLGRKYQDHPTRKFSTGAAIRDGISNVLRAHGRPAVVRALRQGLRDGRACEVEVWKG